MGRKKGGHNAAPSPVSWEVDIGDINQCALAIADVTEVLSEASRWLVSVRIWVARWNRSGLVDKDTWNSAEYSIIKATACLSEASRRLQKSLDSM